MEVHKVGVVGCGLMGSGIAQVCAAAGFPTTGVEISQELCERGLRGIEKNLARQVEKGTLAPEQRDAIRSRLRGSTELAALADSDLIIEAVTENVQAKLETFRQLDGIVKRQAILASNTSSLSITELMTATSRPERFLGLHFFNPVPLMKLVEVVRTIATEPAALETVVAFAERLGKTVVRVPDRAGFIVNRLLIPYLLEAVRALEEGLASVTDIDTAMKLGCGHPMGPLTLLDFIGLDTAYYISQIMYEEFREKRFAAPGLLRRMVLAGWLGRKSGRGFYDYSDPAAPRSLELLR